MTTIKPTIESLNQAAESSRRDRDFKRRPIPQEKFYIKLQDPNTKAEYEIRYFL
jgi:hypothetical protein